MKLSCFLRTIHHRFSQTVIAFMLILLTASIPSYAIDYSGYKLSINTSNAAPTIGKPVVFRAKIEPELDDDKIAYQFLINGEPIAEEGMHKVHFFKKAGTYKVSAVATLGGSYLLNSPTRTIHVSTEWLAPVAEISPKKLTLKTGQPAVFRSNSETDLKSRQWLYWRISSGHRGSGETFRINTSRLKEGQYPVTLLLRDDQRNESTARAVLIIDNNNENILPVEQNTTENEGEEENPNNNLQTIEKPPTTTTSQKTSALVSLTFRASHIHRLTGMPIVYWVQNSQIGADTVLQLDTGDEAVSTWSRRLRYSHVYKKTGVYTAELRAKERNSPMTQQRHTLTVYIWPLWLPLLIGGSIILLALIMLFRQRKKAAVLKKASTEAKQDGQISYQHYPDEGYQQITITEESEQKTASFILSQQPDTGTQTLKSSKGGQPHGTQPHKDH